MLGAKMKLHHKCGFVLLQHLMWTFLSIGSKEKKPVGGIYLTGWS